jgi:hypothetical protein
MAIEVTVTGSIVRAPTTRPGAAVEVLDNPASVAGEPVLRGFVLDVLQIWAVMERKRKA